MVITAAVGAPRDSAHASSRRYIYQRNISSARIYNCICFFPQPGGLPRLGQRQFRDARLKNGRLAEHWDVVEDEVTKAASKSGLPMFGDAFPG